MNIYLFIRNWAEVWAFFIPLSVVWFSKEKIPDSFKPITLYLYIGLALNAISTTMFVYHNKLPDFLFNNNIIYNIHSVIRVTFFSWFLLKTKMFNSNNFFRITLILYAALAIVNFIFFDSILEFSTALMLGETVLLIILCTSYFYHAILDDETSRINDPYFLLTAGLLLFEMLNFFVYLFYTPVGDLLDINIKRSIWTVHNFSLVGLCIVMAVTFKKSITRKLNPDE